MKSKTVFFTLLLLTSITLNGQQAKVAPMQPSQQITTESTLDQQDKIKQLQEENLKLKEDLDKLEKEVNIYREDVREKTSDTTTTMALWAGLITALVTIITGGLGVIYPIYKNKKMEDKLEKIDNRTQKTEDSAKKAEDLAKTAGDSAKKAEGLAKTAGDSAKKAEDLAKTAGDSAKKAEDLAKTAGDSAKEAEIDQLFAKGYAEKEPSKSIEVWDKIINKQSKNYDAYNLRGIAKKDSEDLGGALHDFKKLIEIDPEDFLGFHHTAVTLALLKKYDEALYYINIAISKDRKNKVLYKERGNINYRLDKFKDAINDYSKAIQLDKNYSEAYFCRALARYKDNDVVNSLSDYNKAIELDPNYADAYYNRGILYYEQNNQNNALDDYSRAIKLDEELVLLYHNCGIKEKAEFEYKMAEKYSKKENEYKLKAAEAYYNRGIVNDDLNQLNDALNDFNLAIKHNPEMSEAYCYRAIVHHKLGYLIKAKEDYNQAMQLNPLLKVSYSSIPYPKLKPKGIRIFDEVKNVPE